MYILNDESCLDLSSYFDMQVLEDVVLLETHMHNTKTKPYSFCKRGLEEWAGLTQPQLQREKRKRPIR